MTIKIFNDDPDHYIFPVLTTGQGTPDIWLQSIFKIPQNQVATCTYSRTNSYRIYITDAAGTMPVGIAPNQNVAITIPLYTQLVATVDPTMPNQYIDWWNGGTIQLFTSPTATPPRSLMDDFTNRPNQQPVTSSAVVPTCPACQGLKFFSDNSDLPKADSSQLIEYTLGARVQLGVNNPATDPPNTLDLQNVDFDVYVNVAFAPAAQFVRTYPTSPTSETVLKLASPLEVFARLGPSIAPPDLTPPPHWPDQLWVPIQALRTNWVKEAGHINSVGFCGVLGIVTPFCHAIFDVKALMLANFN